MICERPICDTEFEPRHPAQRFCSPTCQLREEKRRWAAKRRRERGAGTRQRRSYQRKGACEGCGWAEAKCDVHHIDQDHFNNQESNLITLCPNCHRIAHVHGLPSVFDATMIPR